MLLHCTVGIFPHNFLTTILRKLERKEKATLLKMTFRRKNSAIWIVLKGVSMSFSDLKKKGIYNANYILPFYLKFYKTIAVDISLLNI